MTDKKERLVFNPLTKVRNWLCLCDSGLKVKKCCGLIPYLPEGLANEIRTMIKRGYF